MVSRVRISINSSGQEVEIFHGAKDENSSWNFATVLLEGSLIVSGQYHVKSATFLESVEMFESLNYLLADSLSWGPQESNEWLQFRVTEVWPPLEHSPFLSLCHGHCLTNEQRPWGGTGCVQSLKFLLSHARWPSLKYSENPTCGSCSFPS